MALRVFVRTPDDFQALLDLDRSNLDGDDLRAVQETVMLTAMWRLQDPDAAIDLMVDRDLADVVDVARRDARSAAPEGRGPPHATLTVSFLATAWEFDDHFRSAHFDNVFAPLSARVFAWRAAKSTFTRLAT
jgi:hypothetical protein